MKTNLKSIFSSLAGNTFVSIDTETNVVLKGGKQNPLQGRVTKRVIGSNVQCFGTSGYSKMINRRLPEDAPEFISQPRAWGTRVIGMPIVEHGEKEYLEAIFVKAGKVEYLVDGSVVEKSSIAGLEDKEESIQGGLATDKKVIIRTYSADNIKRMKAFGKEFV